MSGQLPRPESALETVHDVNPFQDGSQSSGSRGSRQRNKTNSTHVGSFDGIFAAMYPDPNEAMPTKSSSPRVRTTTDGSFSEGYVNPNEPISRTNTNTFFDPDYAVGSGVESRRPSAPAHMQPHFNMAALRHRKAFVSRALRPDETVEKPWTSSKKRRNANRRAYWIFVIPILLGICGMAGIVYSGVASIPKNTYCLVMQDDFNGNEIDKTIWAHELETGGFGNQEFEWTTDSVNNSYVQDGMLYITPTLTADTIGDAAVLDGYQLNLTNKGCTAAVQDDKSCAVYSNSSTGTIIPPIQSARLVTNFSSAIKYGRIEVRARMPTGDWLWPAIWMMPRTSAYGPWPQSGEIDIFESKGNVPTVRDAGLSEMMRSSLHWGPNTDLDSYWRTTTVRKLYRKFYNQDFHTFGLEWTPDAIFTWEGSPVHKVLVHKFKKSFWEQGDFPQATSNGTTIRDPWSSSPNPQIAPFDQEFFLILNVAAGGTNGYFDDEINKPWSNNAENAVADFWAAKDRWLPSWPTDPKQRSMVVDYVKMWKLCDGSS